MPHPSQFRGRSGGGKKGPRQVTSKRQPKVTLRPGPARDPAAAAAADAEQYDSSEADDNDSDPNPEASSSAYGYREALRGERRPLEGLKVSVSGCDGRKEDLLALAERYGAERHGGLQEDTTHLVTDSPSGKKYDVALQRRMHVMWPSWLPAVRDAWVSGDDVDFRELELQHALPPLATVVACLTGFAKGDYKDDLKRLLVENGAEVTVVLDSRVTHLLVASSSSPHSQTPTSSKLLHVRKNPHRLHPDLAVVWEGWAREAIRYGGVRRERTLAWQYTSGGSEPQQDIRWQVETAPPRCRPRLARAPAAAPLATRRAAAAAASAATLTGPSSSRTIVPVPGANPPRRSFQGYDTSLLDSLDPPPKGDNAGPAYDLAHGKVLKKRRRGGVGPASDRVLPTVPLTGHSAPLSTHDDSQALLEAFTASQLPAAQRRADDSEASRFADADTTGQQTVAELLAATRRAAEPERPRRLVPQIVEGHVEMQLVPKGRSVIQALSTSRQGSFVHSAEDERPRRRLSAVSASKRLGPATGASDADAGHDDSAFFESAPVAAADKTEEDSGEPSGPTSSTEESPYPPIFTGKRIALVELKSPRVSAIRNVIGKCAGVCIDNPRDEELATVDFVIVDYVEPPARFARSPDPRIRTVCWIELCLFYDALLEPADRLLERPLPFACPVPGIDTIRVHLSGFGPEDDPLVHHFRRYCTAIGATYSTYMDRTTTHLVVHALEVDSSLRAEDLDPAQYPKVAKAREWGLAVISLCEFRRAVEAQAEPLQESQQEQRANEALSTIARRDAGPRVRDVTNELESTKPTLRRPLSDCVVFFSTKIDVDRQALASTVEDLGGIAARHYSPSVTHFVFASTRISESAKDFRLARADGAHIVHPRWIYECGRAQSRVSEEDFPHTFDSRKGGQLFDTGMSLVSVSSQVPRMHSASPDRGQSDRPASRSPTPAVAPDRGSPDAAEQPSLQRRAPPDVDNASEGAKTVPSSPAPSPYRDEADNLHGVAQWKSQAEITNLNRPAATSSPLPPAQRPEKGPGADTSSDFDLPPIPSHRPSEPIAIEDPGRNLLREQTSRLLAQLTETSAPLTEKSNRPRSRTALSRGKSSGTISLTTSLQPSPLAIRAEEGSTHVDAAGRVPGQIHPLDPSQATQDESLCVVYDNVAEAAAREQIRRALAGDGEAPPATAYQDPIGMRTRRARANRL